MSMKEVKSFAYHYIPSIFCTKKWVKVSSIFRFYGSERNQGSQPDVKSRSHLSIIYLNHFDYLYRQRVQHTHTQTASTQKQQTHKHTHKHTNTNADTCRKKMGLAGPGGALMVHTRIHKHTHDKTPSDFIKLHIFTDQY